MFDYFYGPQAEQFAFYRVPKVLFTNDRFKYLSAEAKTLYGILLDRVPLSAKNGWIDEQGRVYIICTIEEIMADMKSWRRLQRKKIPGMHRTISPEAALTASTIVRISSIAGASSSGVPMARIRMCFARSL